MQLRSAKRKLDDNTPPPQNVSLKVKPTARGTTLAVKDGRIVGDLRDMGLGPVEMLTALLSKYNQTYTEVIVNRKEIPCTGDVELTNFGLIKLAQKQALIGDSIGVVSRKILNQRICPYFDEMYEKIERVGDDRMGSIYVIIDNRFGITAARLRQKSDVILTTRYDLFRRDNDKTMRNDEVLSAWKKKWKKNLNMPFVMYGDDSPSENIDSVMRYVMKHDITIVNLIIGFRCLDGGGTGYSGCFHANILTYNKIQRTLERFDPNLSTYPEKIEEMLNKLLKGTLADPYGFTYIHAGETLTCPVFPQIHTRQVFLVDCPDGGLCVLYSAMYAYLRMIYPNENWNYIVSDLVSVNPRKLLELTWRFSIMMEVLCEESPCLFFDFESEFPMDQSDHYPTWPAFESELLHKWRSLNS